MWIGTMKSSSIWFGISGGLVIALLLFAPSISLGGAPKCGDKVVTAPETCDPPKSATSGGDCRDDCTFCGDGIVNDDEDCDPGKNKDCTKDCTLPPKGAPFCEESVNPAGKNIPPAGLTLPGVKGGQNPDGFYLVGADDGSPVCIVSESGNNRFGPFPSDSTLKLTEAPGSKGDVKDIGGPKSAVLAHVTLDSDPFVCLCEGGGCDCDAPCVPCLVPPPPK